MSAATDDRSGSERSSTRSPPTSTSTSTTSSSAAARSASRSTRRPGRRRASTSTSIALATRLISRELDHDDPMPGHYTLEVTQPGLERTLRTPAHFQREVGKTVALRLATSPPTQRRLARRRSVAADDHTATVPARRCRGARRAHRRRTTRSTGPRPCSCGARAQARQAAAHQKRTTAASDEQRGSRHEQSRHDRSDPHARPGEEHLRGRPAARARRRPGDRPTSAAPAPPTRSSSRSTPTRWSSPSSPTTSTRTATGSTSATTRRRRKSSAASPPRRSAR